MKNLLVFAAPAAAGLLGHRSVFEKTALAAGLFLVASWGTYLLNDSLDVTADRIHPQKRHRPVASGDLSPALALSLGLAALLLSVSAAGYFVSASFLAVLASYAAVNIAYSLYLKRIPVIELACVTSGFVFRAVAGGAAVQIPISPWFVIVTSACSLLVVTGKRSAELTTLGDHGSMHRVVLEHYTANFLRSVRLLAATVAVVSYALWAFTRVTHLDFGHGDGDDITLVLSVLPFVLAIITVELALQSGLGGAPEELVIHDRKLQALGLACIALAMVGIYT